MTQLLRSSLYLAVLLLTSLTSQGSCEDSLILKDGIPPISAITGGKDRPVAPEYLPELVKVLSPAVVNISVEADSAEAEKELEGVPFFKKDSDRPFRSVGSGFIISSDGYIVTSNHVIEGSSKTIVRLLDDKTEYDAAVIGRDQKTDLALLKIEPKAKLSTVFVGDSDAVQVGEWVVAIGNQFHLGQTVTSGIVSAKSRRVPSPSGSPYDSFIQTDASINPGSSGGPLFNARGQVIGINTAIFSPNRAQTGGTGFNIGIGFAVPVNILKTIIKQLRDSGTVIRGLLGVRIQPVDENIQKALGLERVAGALVAEVIRNTPASSAGFKRKDVIVAFNGEDIGEYEELPLKVANTVVGSTVDIEVIRQGKRKTLAAKIEQVDPEEPTVRIDFDKPNEIGLLVDQVTEVQARALDLPTDVGVSVVSVKSKSAADLAGILKGDVIEEFDDVTIKDTALFDKLVRNVPKGKPVLVTVRRKEGSRILTLIVK